jgi:MFS-type transporter involved in bile tolerance (Atg22 family)
MSVAIASILSAVATYFVGRLLDLPMYPDGIVKLIVYIMIYMGWSLIFKPEAYSYFLTIIPKRFRIWEKKKH